MFSRDQVLALMRERVHHPAGMRELLQLLKIPRDDRTAFKRHIKSLVAAGELIDIRGHRFGLPEKMDLHTGRLQTHSGGYGFVIPDIKADLHLTDVQLGLVATIFNWTYGLLVPFGGYFGDLLRRSLDSRRVWHRRPRRAVMRDQRDAVRGPRDRDLEGAPAGATHRGGQPTTCSVFGSDESTSRPSRVTTTRSSMRTPSSPGT